MGVESRLLMANGDLKTGSFATLAKHKKGILGHLGSGGGGAVATLLLVSQIYGGDIKDNRDSVTALNEKVTTEFKSVRQESSTEFRKVTEQYHQTELWQVRMEGLLTNIASEVGADTSTPEPVIVMREPVIKFVLPSDTFPVGGVYSVGDTTFIPTLDSFLLVRDST